MKQNKNQYMDLTSDSCFKAYFKESNGVIKSLLKNFIPLLKGQKIKSVQFFDSVINTENPKDKDSFLDLRVHLDNGMSINIEMQTADKESFTERILFYLCRLYTRNLKKGEEYVKICPAYSLVFTTFTVFKELENFYSLFQLTASQNPKVVFSHYLGIVFVELNKFKEKDLSKIIDLRDVWCYLMKNARSMGSKDLKEIAKKGEEMKQAAWRLEKLSKEESQELIEEAKEKARRDRVAEIAYSRNAEREKIARKMLIAGSDINFIQTVTGLSKDHILKLKTDK